jgi:GT2 family glycosyltransferase
MIAAPTPTARKRAKMLLGATVVLFNPSADDIDHLITLTKPAKDVVAVDNSPDPDAELHARLNAQDIRVIENRNAGGLARGLNLGIRELLARGCDVACVFDQDSKAPDDYFEALASAADELDRPDFIIGPVVHITELDQTLPAVNFSRWGVSVEQVPEDASALTPSMFIITSGTAVSRAAFDKLGDFKEEYFIECLDTEYAFRAAVAGVPSFIHAGVLLQHSIATTTKHALGFVAYNRSPARCYYCARNTVALSREYVRTRPVVLLWNLSTALQVITIVFFEKDKGRKLVATFAGILDGLRGKWRTYGERRP